MINLTPRLFPQPTIYIDLGGTGGVIFDQRTILRASLPEEVRHYLEPFLIDAQAPQGSDPARLRHYYYRDLNEFRDPVYKEFYARRFPENLGVNPVVNSSQGCGVTRIFGAASLVACRDDFVDTVLAAANRLRRVRSKDQLIQVFITASSCGGAGAGMLLDAAALVRFAFRRHLNENPRVLLFLAGPAAFFEDSSMSLREEQRERMMASTYGLLKELHHFAQGNPFASAYRLRDEVIEISNASDDDRLFDWVFYMDGRSREGMAAKSREELAWAIAETQIHMSVSEVGWKLAESIPNLREESTREFATNFVHSDNRSQMGAESLEQLAASARRTFMASLAIRNVRFPAPEIGNFLRARWVEEALGRLLLRDREEDPRTLSEEMDRRLGLSADGIGTTGLLGRAGLSPADLATHLSPRPAVAADLAPLSPDLKPQQAMKRGRELMDAAERLVEQMRRGFRALPEEEPAVAGASELDAGLDTWRRTWASRFPELTAGLEQLAWDPIEGRGGRWLDELVRYAADALEAQVRRQAAAEDLSDLDSALDRVRRGLDGLENKMRHEERSLAFKLRTAAGRLLQDAGSSEPYSDRTRKRVKVQARQLNGLVKRVLGEWRTRLAGELTGAVCREVASDLKAWRRDVLTPTLTSLANADSEAEAKLELAKLSLARYRGGDGGGQWTSHTTELLADSEVLAQLEPRIREYSVDDAVLRPLSERGLTWNRHRLSPATARRMSGSEIVEVLSRHVERSAAPILEFLDQGWQLPELRKLLPKAALSLDRAASPLVAYSESSVGHRPLGYLLLPRDVVPEEPFGNAVGRWNRLEGADPLSLTAISFAFGIPPNLLEGIDTLYRSYHDHLGDQKRNAEHDRYPVHVFREAAETFDEPYSPLDLSSDDEFLGDLVQAAEVLGIYNGGGLVLRVRPGSGDKAELSRDWNRLIELSAVVIRGLTRSPEKAEQILAPKPASLLTELYLRRSKRTPRWLKKDDSGATEGVPAAGTRPGKDRKETAH